MEKMNLTSLEVLPTRAWHLFLLPARPFLLLAWVYTGGDLIWDPPLIIFTISIMLLFALYLHSRRSY